MEESNTDLKPLYDHMTQHFPRGKCIIFILNQIGLPSGKIAQKHTISIDYMSLMVNGHRRITPAVRKEISDALGFDPWAETPQ